MFAIHRCARSLACVAAFGLMIAPIFGAHPVSPASKPNVKVVDVKLADGGKLLGQVVSSAGKPQAGVRVIVASKKTTRIAETQADEIGRFSLVLPDSGVYRVAIADRRFTIRAWLPNMAPPTSKTGLLCVTDDVVRGQFRPRSQARGGYPVLKSLLTNPIVIGLGVASAIALPIALDDDDDIAIGAGDDLGESEPAS